MSTDGTNLVGELVKTFGSLQPAVKSLTGIDLAAAIGHKLQPGASGADVAHAHRSSEKSAKK